MIHDISGHDEWAFMWQPVNGACHVAALQRFCSAPRGLSVLTYHKSRLPSDAELVSVSGKSESIQSELHSCLTVPLYHAFILHSQTPSQTGKINSFVEHPASLPSLLLLPQQRPDVQAGRAVHSGITPASWVRTGKTMCLCCCREFEMHNLE